MRLTLCQFNNRGSSVSVDERCWLEALPHSSPCSPDTHHSTGHPAFLYILKTPVQPSVRKGNLKSRDNCPERCHDCLQASTVWLALSPLRRARGRRASHPPSRCSRDSSASPFPYNCRVPAHPKTIHHGRRDVGRPLNIPGTQMHSLPTPKSFWDPNLWHLEISGCFAVSLKRCSNSSWEMGLKLTEMKENLSANFIVVVETSFACGKAKSNTSLIGMTCYKGDI